MFDLGHPHFLLNLKIIELLKHPGVDEWGSLTADAGTGVVASDFACVYAKYTQNVCTQNAHTKTYARACRYKVWLKPGFKYLQAH